MLLRLKNTPNFKMERLKQERLEFIEIVLKEFDEQNINYCILRNYEFLLGSPMPIESLDTVISERDLFKVDKGVGGANFPPVMANY